MKKISRDKKIVALAISLIAFLSIITISVIAYTETRYNILQNNYDFLESKYESLNKTQSNDYDSLMDEYNELETNFETIYNKYSQINKDYNVYKDSAEQYNTLLIDHLMSLTYSKLRGEYQPNYDPWSDDPYYYEQISVEYAANVCAYDLGRIYWPDIEDKYYEIIGNWLSDEAYYRLSEVTDIINISTSDSDVEKVEKILFFTSNFIEYQYDLNDEFLFPTETLTYRSGDCDDFSILAAALFEYVGIESSIGFFESEYEEYAHCMVLIKLSGLGEYSFYYYDNLVDFGLSEGEWFILEPQNSISEQAERNWFERWDLYAAAEIPD